MELFFKRYFWTVHLLFIAVVAYMLARTVNVFVEGALLALPSSTGRSAAASQPADVVAMLDIEGLSRVTGLPVPAPEPEVTLGGGEPAVDMNSQPVKTSLRVRLLGTLLAGLKQWSLASIQDMNTQKSQTFFIGDKIQGAEVLEIERNRVIIKNNGHREFINNEAGDGAAPVAAAPTPSQPVAANGASPNTGLGTGIRALDENNYEVPRAEIDRTLSNLNEVAMQARIVPAFKDGVAHGFKLFSIRPDSIYSKIGVQNGDVIRRINGFDLNSPEKALEIYSKLKEASRIEIDIDRNGSVLKKTYSVR
jgi:general secretion pathway protein C